MYELFYKYLILNNKASLPGVGVFFVENIPASMDFENKKIIPPSQKISLLNNENADDNNALFQYCSQELNLDKSETELKVRSFGNEIKNQITTNGTVDFPGIGKLIKSMSGGFLLETVTVSETKQTLPDLYINKSQAANTSFMEVYSDVMPSIIRRENFIERNEVLITKETEDYWWVWAIVLAIMGLGALLYYYI